MIFTKHAIEQTTGAHSVAAGDKHSCALLVNGSIYCWGSNDFGQLGTGDLISSTIPRPVTELDIGVFYNENVPTSVMFYQKRSIHPAMLR